MYDSKLMKKKKVKGKKKNAVKFDSGKVLEHEGEDGDTHIYGLEPPSNAAEKLD